MVERQRRLDEASHTGRAQQVADIALDRAQRAELDLVRGRMRLNIEIKNTEEHFTVVDNVLYILKKNSFHDVFISSFSRDIIELVKDIDASVKTGYLFDRKLLKNVFAGNWDYLCTVYSLVNEEFTKKGRDAGKKVYVWTVNSPLEMQKMIGLGVDGIITNYPGELLKLLQNG